MVNRNNKGQFEQIFDSNIGIYVITNKHNNKRYIGQSITIHKRLVKHKNELIKNRHYNSHMQSSFNKYGINNFSFDELEICLVDELDIREKYWILYYKTIDKNFGYNKQDGGCETRIVSEETKMKISASQTGRKLSDEWRESIRISRIGTKHSAKTIEKLSKLKKGKSQINSGTFKRGIVPWNSGKKMPDDYGKNISNSLLNSDKVNRVKLTDEMLEDIKNNMTRRAFEAKYGHQGIWVRTRKLILKNNTLIKDGK
jgi:group I intron endonuclease